MKAASMLFSLQHISIQSSILSTWPSFLNFPECIPIFSVALKCVSPIWHDPCCTLDTVSVVPKTVNRIFYVFVKVYSVCTSWKSCNLLVSWALNRRSACRWVAGPVFKLRYHTNKLLHYSFSNRFSFLIKLKESLKAPLHNARINNQDN